ncbi:MAG: FecR domain-containing protein, partial [Bdellovibrionales bacterium]
LDCGPCKEEQGLTFYSEKCGPGGQQVKSCARPTCVALENPPPTCAEKARTPASQDQKNMVQATHSRGEQIGQIKVVEGKAWLKLPDGSKLPVGVGHALHERDSLQTDKAGKVFVEFKDGNLIQVQNDTVVKVSEYEMAEEKRKAVIELLKGQLRNQVKQKYNGQTTTYQVKTKTAVAGVRGTDFVVTYQEGERVETVIKTIEGRVMLANKDYSQSLEVAAGEQASYVVASSDVFGQDEINEFVARGYMTPVHRMNAREIQALMKNTSTNVARQTATVKQMICSTPKAELNQCSWTCQNNPKGEKTCRTDLPQVNCLRRRCNANGEWAEESRMPASFHEQCAPAGFKVAPCDY